MSMSINRIKYLRQELDAGIIDTASLLEIQEAFDQISDDQLNDERENAVAGDMLDELEAAVSPLEWAIYDYVIENLGESEANDPSWDISELAAHLENNFHFEEK